MWAHGERCGRGSVVVRFVKELPENCAYYASVARKTGLSLCVLSRNSSVASFPFFPRCFILGGFVLYSSSENGTLLLLGEWKRTAGILLLKSHSSISRARIHRPPHGMDLKSGPCSSFIQSFMPALSPQAFAYFLDKTLGLCCLRCRRNLNDVRFF